MTSSKETRPAVAFITERQVGLKTYSDNLERFVAEDQRIRPTWHPIDYSGSTLVDRVPGVPESLRGAARGRAQVLHAIGTSNADAHLFLTQTPLALGGALARKQPFVVMMDDTPHLYDLMAEHYGEAGEQRGPVASAKHKINVQGLRAAYRLLPMSQWAKSSLIDDYGVADANIEVIPTGIDLEDWRPGPSSPHVRPRILFVGGDFERKGGPMLLDAFTRLAGSAELDIVTRSDVDAAPGIRVHKGLTANSAPLRELFATSDLFVLPSRGEAFPNVVVEACASGLPSIVTAVGGMAEMVVDGTTGFVVQPDDIDELTTRLESLVSDGSMRASMSAAARQRAEDHYDGRVNAGRVVDLLLEAAASA